MQVLYTHIHYIPQQVVICAGPIHQHTLYSSIGGHLCRSYTPTYIIFLNRWSFVQVLYTNIHYIPQQVVICAGIIHPHTLYSSTGGHLCRYYTPTYIIFLNRWSFVQGLLYMFPSGLCMYYRCMYINEDCLAIQYSGSQKLQDDLNMAAISYFQHTCNFLDILANLERETHNKS